MNTLKRKVDKGNSSKKGINVRIVKNGFKRGRGAAGTNRRINTCSIQKHDNDMPNESSKNSFYTGIMEGEPRFTLEDNKYVVYR